MKISAKGRYALCSLIVMTQNYGNGQYMNLSRITEQLGFSRLYCEQVFALLKKNGLVRSIKGAQGGYQMMLSPKQISVYDVLNITENVIFDRNEETVSEKAPEIEQTLQEKVFQTMDYALQQSLQTISLYDLSLDVEKHKQNDSFMFFI